MRGEVYRAGEERSDERAGILSDLLLTGWCCERSERARQLVANPQYTILFMSMLVYLIGQRYYDFFPGLNSIEKSICEKMLFFVFVNGYADDTFNFTTAADSKIGITLLNTNADRIDLIDFGELYHHIKEAFICFICLVSPIKQIKLPK